MSRIVSYLSKPNHEVRDASGRFEGTFRWHWLASLWATVHPDRHMHLVQARPGEPLAQGPAAAPVAAVVQAPVREQAAGGEVRSAPARRARRRPAVQRAA
ncbi:MAG: hypothetical protein DLM67_04340 [Candidatus Nephthysia bennettiae]|nr:hypothetical protein [Candidatus Dormibacteraeota bacterium]PZR99194.1 MAG: hypothetical protein DLM67_04340 [Candidatus Dormibacteraeota bacterium]